MCCVRWSNEAATVHADITVDHRDVPAHRFFGMASGQAKNRTRSICFTLHGCRNLDDYFILGQNCISEQLIQVSTCFHYLTSTPWTILGVYIFSTKASLLFSGIQFSSDRSDDPCLIKCVIHGTRLEGTQDGRMLIDLTSEFTLLY